MTGVTADSTLWTADTICVTADGRVICIDADVVEPVRISITADTSLYTADNTTWPTADGGAGGATDNFDAVVEVAGAVIVVEAADALDQLDADVEAAAAVIGGGGARYYPPPRPAPVVGVGYGVLPELEGEAHGVVGTPTGGVDDFPNDVELMLMLLAA
jgi:hypothetical protein